MESLRYYCGRCREKYEEHRIFVSAKRNALRKNAVFLLGTPIHPNLGDQAIALAEIEFFEQKGYAVVEIPSPLIEKHLDIWEKIIGKKRIYIHGGGFVGTLWPEEEAMMESIISSFPNNEIVILPQTIFFENVDAHVERLNNLLVKHGNVVLCTREIYSYSFACQHLQCAKVLLVPDMVLMSNWFDGCKQERENIIFCMRRDLEKTITDETVEKLTNLTKLHYPEAKIIFTDTVGEGYIYPKQREKVLRKKLREFASAKLVVTDRLHGMVLSAMANTPTLAFSNCNYKVKGIYNWISNNSFLSYCDDVAKVEELFRELIKEEKFQYDNQEAIKAFEPLKEIVGNYHE